MWRSSRKTQRGAALLVVLAALTVTLTSATLVARIASTARLARDQTAALQQADRLRDAADPAILAWLQNEADEIVLAASARRPAVSLLHDVLFAGGQRLELRITAFDQCGMIPLELLRLGSPLRSALPEEVLQTLDRTRLPSRTSAGLDLFTGEGTVFPEPEQTEAMTFGNAWLDSRGAAIPKEASASLALGDLVAMHNPEGRINTRTAPAEVLEVVFRSLGRSGHEQVLAARESHERNGEGASFPGAASSGSGRSGEQSRLSVSDRSERWSFRVDVRVDGIRRSWWSTYRRQGASWRRVQQLVITE